MLVIGIGARYGEEMTSSPPPAPGPLCVQCGRTVKSLYKEYSKDNIRLTRCAHCEFVADHYIEYELILIVLDLALHKVQAYRHLLFNRRPYCDLDYAGLLRVACALVVLDTHIKYAVYIDGMSSSPLEHAVADPMDNMRDQIRLVGLIFLLCMFEMLVYTLVVVGASLLLGSRKLGFAPGAPPVSSAGAGEAKQPSVRGEHQPWLVVEKLFKAVLYPNFGRLLVVFVMIWDQQVVVINIISMLVITSQYRALQAVMEPPGGFEDWRAQARQVAGALSAGLLCKALVVLAVDRPLTRTRSYLL